MREEINQEFFNKLSRRLSDDGKVIEAGWTAFLAVVHPEAPLDQRKEMELAFYAGAQHLFASIMNLLDPGQEPTDADMRRMSLIADELQKWYDQRKREAEFKRKHE